MAGDKDEQLQQFFLQHNTNDPQYLKRYVKQHPENKMAWYLLGREYAAKGQQAKANYCFAQAGEVYAAFELVGITPTMERLFTEHKGTNMLTPRPLILNVSEQQPQQYKKTATVSVMSAAEPFTQSLEIIVDKLHHRLALVSGNIVLRNYAVGLGGNRTPEGTFTITEKVRNPNGKSNGVFGSRGMTLSDTLYAIHGTDEPSSIGKDESKGCVRMNNEDIEQLFSMAPLGTKVTIRKGGFPEEVIKGEPRFLMPVMNKETNPHKKYKWLN